VQHDAVKHGLQPDLHGAVGSPGVRWTVAGAANGTMEIWLEPVLDGVVLHYFLHAEPAGDTARMNLAAINHRRRVAGKRMAFEVKNSLEASRPVGAPPAV